MRFLNKREPWKMSKLRLEHSINYCCWKSAQPQSNLAVRSTLVFVPGLLPAETGVATQDSVWGSPGEVGEARTDPVTVGDPGYTALWVTEVLVCWTLHLLTGWHHGHWRTVGLLRDANTCRYQSLVSTLYPGVDLLTYPGQSSCIPGCVGSCSWTRCGRSISLRDDSNHQEWRPERIESN